MGCFELSNLIENDLGAVVFAFSQNNTLEKCFKTCLSQNFNYSGLYGYFYCKNCKYDEIIF